MKNRVLSVLKGSVVVLFVHSIVLILSFLHMRYLISSINWMFFGAILLFFATVLLLFLFRKEKCPWVFLIAVAVSEIVFSFAAGAVFDYVIDTYYSYTYLKGWDYDFEQFVLHVYFASLIGMGALVRWIMVLKNRRMNRKEKALTEG